MCVIAEKKLQLNSASLYVVVIFIIGGILFGGGPAPPPPLATPMESTPIYSNTCALSVDSPSELASVLFLTRHEFYNVTFRYIMLSFTEKGG